MSSLEDLSKPSLIEFTDMFCGDFLGEGMSRRVYRHAHDRTKVIKIENTSETFQNVIEWELWEVNQYYDKVSKWLAPCRFISHSGTYLVMDYVEDIEKSQIPAKLPSFMCDLKVANMGMYNDQIVLRDYGTTILNLNTRLVNVDVDSIY